MIKTLLRGFGLAILAALISVPLSNSASALTSQTPAGSLDTYPSIEAMVLIKQILILEKQNTAAEAALKSVQDRIAKQDELVAAKRAEITKLVEALKTATGKTKVSLERQLRVARFDLLKLDSGYRVLTTERIQANMRVEIISDMIAAQRAKLDELTNGACSVSNGGFSCVL